MSSKRQRRITKRQKLLFEVYGVLIISLSILLFISLYFSSGGIIGNIAGNLMKSMLGFGSFIIPLFMLLLGIGLIVKQDRITLKLRFYALFFLFVFFIITIQINKSALMTDLTFIERVKTSYKLGSEGIGGGAIGEILTYPVIILLGMIGAYVFSITFMIINLLIITDASIYKIILFIKNEIVIIFNNLKKITGRYPHKSKSHKTVVTDSANANKAEPYSDKKEYIENINKKIKILDFFKSSEIAGSAESSVDIVSDKLGSDIEYNNMEVLREQPVIKEAQRSPVKKDDSIKDEISIHTKMVPHNYMFPPINLLNSSIGTKNGTDKKELISNAKILEDTLDSFGVEAKVVQVSRGPSITRYELQPSPGVKVSKIVNLSDDIALNLAAPAVRIEAPIPGKAAVGIEVPNKEISAVLLREVIESKEFSEHPSPLAFSLGKDVAGNCIIADMAKMPHLLIAGATGSGKSVCVNSLITSILYKAPPEKVRLLMIDPKVVELNTYNGIPHLLIPVVTDPRKAAGALGWAVQEMTNRYKLFADNNVRNIEGYNDFIISKNPESILPKIVIIIDELADLMMVAANDVEDCICRLAQMARAAGMHLVVATQRPSVDVLTGVIKANIPSRISFAVSSQIDSRTILDMAGAEKLLGKGDMLYYPVGESKPIRVQGAFVSEKEVEQVVGFVKEQAVSEYREEIIDEIENVDNNLSEADELLPEAIKIVVDTGQASISLLQRRLRVGYNRAARLIDNMEERGIIGGYEGSKPRQVLISKENYEEML